MSSVSSLLTSSYSTNSSSAAYSVSNILASMYGSSTAAIDVSAAVSAGIYADRAPERAWETELTTLSSEKSDIEKLESATQAVLSDLDNLNNISGVLQSRVATSSNSNYVVATASSNAPTGTHTVEVDQLATKASWYSAAESSASTTLPTSSITITTESGSSKTFDTGSGAGGDTLTDLAAAINSASMGVTASVVTDSSGARLALVSNSSGVSNGFTVAAEDYTGSSWTSDTLSSSATLDSGNTVTITGSGSGAPSVSVTTYSGETYTELADAINSAISTYNSSASASGGSTLNVTATSGSGSSGTYFSLASSDSSSFTVNQPVFDMTEGAAAQDAIVKVDGVPVTSATNTVSGAVSGVTMYLYDSYSGVAFNLTVAPDVTSMSSAINQLVTDYNSAIDLVTAQYTVSSSTDSSGSTTVSQGSLASDPTLRNFQTVLQNLVSYVSASAASGEISMLYAMGITANDDGTLSVDSTTLSDVLTSSTSAVEDFFMGDSFNGFSTKSYSALYAFTGPLNGAFTIDLKSISSESSDLESHIEEFESGYISSQIVLLTNEYTQAEQALQSLSTTMKQYNALLSSSS
jgi:flagellar hook-associated protein 2